MRKMLKKVIVMCICTAMVCSLLNIMPTAKVTQVKAQDLLDSWKNYANDYSYLGDYGNSSTERFKKEYSLDTYHIKTATQLATVLLKGRKTGKTIILDNDIDLSGKKWDFNTTLEDCIFDGNGHSIVNLDLGEMKSFIYRLSTNSAIINMTIENSKIENSTAGTLVDESYGTVFNCHIKMTNDTYIMLTQSCLSAGLIGKMYGGEVKACSVDANIKVSDNVESAEFSGIVGEVSYCDLANISDSYFIGEVINGDKVEKSAIVGQIDGYSNVSIENCYFVSSTVDKVISQIDGKVTYKNVYFDSEINKNIAQSEQIIGKSSEELMSLKESQSGFDFENIWTTEPNQYPQISKSITKMDFYGKKGCPDIKKIVLHKNGLILNGTVEPISNIVVFSVPYVYENTKMTDDENTSVDESQPYLELTTDEGTQVFNFSYNKFDVSYNNETYGYSVVYKSDISNMFVFTADIDLTKLGKYVSVDDYENDYYEDNEDNEEEKEEKIVRMAFIFGGDVSSLTTDNIIDQWFTKGLKMGMGLGDYYYDSGFYSNIVSDYGANYSTYMLIGDNKYNVAVTGIHRTDDYVDWNTILGETLTDEDFSSGAFSTLPDTNSIKFVHTSDGRTINANITSGNLVGGIIYSMTDPYIYELKNTAVSNEKNVVNYESSMTAMYDKEKCNSILEEYSKDNYMYQSIEDIMNKMNSICKKIDVNATTIYQYCLCKNHTWKVVKEPTKTTEGLEEYVCDYCGKVEKTRTIPKLADTIVNTAAFTNKDILLYAGGNINTNTILSVKGNNIKTIVYTSSDSKIAKVEQGNKLVATKKGSAVVTATVTFKDGTQKKLTTKVIVKKAYVSLSAKSKKLKRSKKIKISVVRKGYKISSVKWRLSNKNAKIVSKSNKAVIIKGIKKGTVVVKAKVNKKTITVKIKIRK